MAKEQFIQQVIPTETPIGVQFQDDNGNWYCHGIADEAELDAVETRRTDDPLRRKLKWREKHGALPPGLRNMKHKFQGLPSPKDFPLPENKPVTDINPSKKKRRGRPPWTN